MAVTANSYFSNAIVGVPQVAAGQVNIFKEDINPRFAIGTKFERQDGAVFRYAHFGATINSAGLGVSQDVSESSQTMTPLVVVASSSTYQMPEETTGVYPCMKDSKYLIITLASVTTDQFAGGYITLSSGNTAQGATYRIKGNTATGDPTSGNFRAELYERLQSGVGSSTAFTIIGSKYANLETWGVGGTTDSIAAGVAMIPITTANDYGWIQTKGIVGVLVDGAVLAGRSVIMSTASGGAVQPALTYSTATSGASYQLASVVGYSCVNSTSGTFVPIWLDVE